MILVVYPASGKSSSCKCSIVGKMDVYFFEDNYNFQV